MESSLAVSGCFLPKACSVKMWGENVSVCCFTFLPVSG